jgi:hypothetical protein
VETIGVDRLDEVRMKSSASGSPTVVIVAVSRDGHKQGPGERSVVTHTLGNLVAVNAGHGQVAQYYVGAEVVACVAFAVALVVFFVAMMRLLRFEVSIVTAAPNVRRCQDSYLGSPGVIKRSSSENLRFFTRKR